MIQRRVSIAIGAFVVMVLGLTVYFWYASLPKPVRVSLYVTSPGRTRIEDPDARPDPVSIRFSISVAPLAAVGKDVKNGIELNPSFDGVWRWDTDSILVFRPKTDWPVDTEFRVTLSRQGLTAQQILLERYETKFRTAPFVATLTEAMFYQDPVDPASN